MKINPKFDIKDIVYHVTPESPKGIVIDWRYYRVTNEYHYLVSIGFGQEFWCTEHELAIEKQF